MHAYGSDRLRRGTGEQWVIFSPRPKGWVARTPPAVTRRERPGTAVLWEDRYFEVISATPSGSGVRYVLEPWRDEHVMRVVDAYDERSEAQREAEHKAAVARAASRKAATLLGVLTGHLPAAVQERMRSELGVLPTRLTLISIIPVIAFVSAVVFTFAGAVVEQRDTPPIGILLVAVLLIPESGVRAYLAMMQGRPCGSVAGWIVYALFYLIWPYRRNLVPPVEVRASEPPLRRDVPVDVRLQDAYTVREPLVTLLTPAEQRVFEQRFGFDYRRYSSKIAVLLLAFSVAGIVTSVMSLRAGGQISALLSLLVAAGLAVEQIARLRALRRGPAGSVLGLLVRPFVRKLSVPA